MAAPEAFIIGKAYGTMSAEWPTLLAQSFLLQAWVPHFTENALQMHCWFLSRWAAGANLDNFCRFFFLQVGGMIVERSRSWGWNAAHRSILLILTYTNVTNTSCFMVIQVGVNGVDSSCRRSNFHIITLISSTTWLVQEVRQPFPISKAAWWCIGSSSNPCPTFWRTSLCWRRVCSWASSSFLPWLLIFIPVIANEDVDWYKDSQKTMLSFCWT